MQSTSSADTERLGERIGVRLRGGEVIELASDLGGGKTTFTRGIVRGAGSSDKVASPTFTVSREYNAQKFTIVHFDFYRLGEAGVVAEELREYVHDPSFVVIVEWGGVVADILPAERLTVEIESSGDEERIIKCRYPSSLVYLFEGLDR